jgi:hypothetical protein
VRAIGALGATLFLFVLAAPARANGRFPAANQLALTPADPGLLVLRTTFGIVVSHDGGITWDWICESAVGFGGAEEDPAIGVLYRSLASSTLVVATATGLAVSPDTGCSWTSADSRSFLDVAVRPQNSAGAVALSPWVQTFGDGGQVTVTPATLLATTDYGATWTLQGTPLPAAIHPTTVDVAASDSHRIYVGGADLTSGVPQGALLKSVDDGQTWTEGVIPLALDNETNVLIAGIDPTNADRVYLRVLGAYGVRLVVTDDGGQTSRTLLTLQVPMLGFALSPDGSTVYAGGPDGLRVASSSDWKFSMVTNLPIGCLAANAELLYACSSEMFVNGFALGASSTKGASFRPILYFDQIRGPLQCASDATAAQCVAQWPALTPIIEPDGGGASPAGDDGGGDAGKDGGGAGGASDASVLADGGAARETAKGCACTSVGVSAGGIVWAVLALAGSAGAVVRRRQRVPQARSSAFRARGRYRQSLP